MPKLDKFSAAQTVQYIMQGGRVVDCHEDSDRLLMSLMPWKSEYYEIVPLGSEYCFRTPDRKYEVMRVPRSIGGLFLLNNQFDLLVQQAMVYCATGGHGV